jgi:hypothetical protein
MPTIRTLLRSLAAAEPNPELLPPQVARQNQKWRPAARSGKIMQNFGAAPHTRRDGTFVPSVAGRRGMSPEMGLVLSLCVSFRVFRDWGLLCSGTQLCGVSDGTFLFPLFLRRTESSLADNADHIFYTLGLGLKCAAVLKRT